MLGVGENRANLIILLADIVERVGFSAIHNALLHGGVLLGSRHWDAGSAHQIQHGDHGVRLHNTELHAFQISWSANFLLTENVAGTGGQRSRNDKSLVGCRLEQLIQHIAGVNRTDVLIAVKQIRGGENCKVRVIALHDGRIREAHIYCAALRQFQRGLLVAQLAIRENRHGIAAVRPRCQLLGDPFQHLMMRIIGGLVTGNLQILNELIFLAVGGIGVGCVAGVCRVVIRVGICGSVTAGCKHSHHAKKHTQDQKTGNHFFHFHNYFPSLLLSFY